MSAAITPIAYEVYMPKKFKEIRNKGNVTLIRLNMM